MTISEEELWVRFAVAAASNFSMPDVIEGDEELQDIVDDMLDVSINFADDMLQAFAERFESGASSRRQGGKKRRRKTAKEEE